MVMNSAVRASTHGAPSTTAATFPATLRTWRLTRGLSQEALARKIMYSRSLVNLVENGHRRATEAFALAADAALNAAGQLHAAWTPTKTEPAREPMRTPAVSTTAPGPEHDDRAPGTALIPPDASTPYTTRSTRRRRAAERTHSHVNLAVLLGWNVHPGCGGDVRRQPTAPPVEAPQRWPQLRQGDPARRCSRYNDPRRGLYRANLWRPAFHVDQIDVSKRVRPALDRAVLKAAPRVDRCRARRGGHLQQGEWLPIQASETTGLMALPTHQAGAPDIGMRPHRVASSRARCDVPAGTSSESKTRRHAVDTSHTTSAGIGRLAVPTAAADAPTRQPTSVVDLDRLPSTVADPVLWRYGVVLGARHREDPRRRGGCVDARCQAGRRGTCWVGPVAAQLVSASSGSWVRRWTARLDARSCGLPVPDAVPADSDTGPCHRPSAGDGPECGALPSETLAQTFILADPSMTSTW